MRRAELKATLRHIKLADLSNLISWIPPSCSTFLPLFRSSLYLNWQDALENRNYFTEVTFSSSQSKFNWALVKMAISVRLRDVASPCLWWKNLWERENESENSLISCDYAREEIKRPIKCWYLRYAGGCNIHLKIWPSRLVSKSLTSSPSHYLECPYPHSSFSRVVNHSLFTGS